MNFISVSLEIRLRVSGLTLHGTSVILPTPTSRQRQPWNQWFLICWWICKKSYLASCSPIPLFSTSAPLHDCFSRCAVRERGQPHPSTEWHSMRRRKGEEKSCLVLSLMSKSMHQSLKRSEREKEREKLLGPQGPGQNTHRSSYRMLWIGAFFNLAQQYLSPEPLIGQTCN